MNVEGFVKGFKPLIYDEDFSEAVYRTLFCENDKKTEAGLMEIPAGGYQLIVSALESLCWEVDGHDRDTLKEAVSVVTKLRDRQKVREWKRERKENA